MKYDFISRHSNRWPIDVMCRVLGVWRTGYYRYINKRQDPDPSHQTLVSQVKQIALASDYSYGSRRISRALRALCYRVGRDQARSLMKQAQIQVRRRTPYKVTTDSRHQQPVYENVLARGFQVDQINHAYVSDITYLRTQQGWLYLAVVIDLCSRRVVGWSMDSRMKTRLVCDALTMAVWQRQSAAGLIVHSDRGSQYASDRYRDLLEQHGFVGSMSRKGDCWDNAVAESFFGRLKSERVQWQTYRTRDQARNDVLNYITMFYNPYRLHSYLGYQSPKQYEANLAAETQQAA